MLNPIINVGQLRFVVKWVKNSKFLMAATEIAQKWKLIIKKYKKNC